MALSYDATIDVNIDKASLVDAIAQDICSRCDTGTSTQVNPQLFKPLAKQGTARPGDHELKWIGGWWISKTTASGVYPKTQIVPPYVPVKLIDTDQAIVVGSAFYIYSLHDAWLLFNERAPQYAGGVLGFFLHNTGSITIVQGGGTAAGTTSMEVSEGDIVLLMWIIGNDDDVLKIRFVGGHYDWATDTWNTEIDAIENIPESEQQNLRYVVLHEPAGSVGTLFIGPYQMWWARATILSSDTVLDHLGYDFKALKLRGLADPSTITP